jgi:hypothetical protein
MFSLLALRGIGSMSETQVDLRNRLTRALWIFDVGFRNINGDRIPGLNNCRTETAKVP